MKMTPKQLAIYASLVAGHQIGAMKKIRSRIAASLDKLDGADAATLIKLGSDMSRAISALDWRIHELSRSSIIINEHKKEFAEGSFK